MAYLLLKTEPDAYSFEDLERDGRTRWDGVTNALALKHLRAAEAGDLAAVYHTGGERRAVGIAEITSAPYPDPAAGDPRLVVFDLAPRRRLARPVELAQLKASTAFCDSPLLKMGRLSVVPLTAEQWQALLTLAETRL